MKSSLALLATSALLSLLAAASAQAEDVALSFDLPAVDPPDTPQPAQTPAPDSPVDPAEQPLPIPPGATRPPVRYHSSSQLPAGVYRRGVAVALNQGATAASLLPAAPPILHVSPVAVATAPAADSEPAETAPPPQDNPEPSSLALAFEQVKPTAPRQPQVQAPAPLPIKPIQMLFEGGNDSLVAIAVGSAEGTRTPTGAITSAYFGHTDPGNRAWNMGTFSYQHGASSPEEANQKQLQRLQSQSEYLKKRALKYDLNLTLEEMLNGIDLANQSPLAALGRVGYVERLVEARNMGYEGAEAIVVARTRSYINPDTQRWNAPGLGNTLQSITRDQQRRADAVASAIAAYQQKNPDLATTAWRMVPPPDATPTVPAKAPVKPDTKALDEEIFQVWTDEDDPQPSQAQLPPLEDSPQPAEPSPNDNPTPVASDTSGATATRASQLTAVAAEPDHLATPGAVPDTVYYPPLDQPEPPLSLQPKEPDDAAAPARVEFTPAHPSKAPSPPRKALPLPAGLLQRLSSQPELDSQLPETDEATDLQSTRERITTSLMDMSVSPMVPQG